MKSALERLFTLRGIRAAAAFDAKGVLLASHGDAAADLERAAPGVFDALRATSSTSAADRSILRFEGGTVVVRRTPEVQLLVLGDPDFDVSERGAALPIDGALTALKMGVRRSTPPR